MNEIFYTDDGQFGGPDQCSVIVDLPCDSTWPDHVYDDFYNHADADSLFNAVEQGQIKGATIVPLEELLKLRTLVSELRDGNIAYDRKSWQEFKDAAGNLDLW